MVDNKGNMSDWMNYLRDNNIHPSLAAGLYSYKIADFKNLKSF
jgi:hypothetical protein